MKIHQFKEAIERNDFVIGDSFWIDDWEFEVVDRKFEEVLPDEDETVFTWELTKDEFVQIIKNNHPEIENPEDFFDNHASEIIRCFENGFDVLISGCGATYGTIMNDAVESIFEHLKGGR